MTIHFFQQPNRTQIPNQRQKLGIIRGPDGKITSVTGLQPGQKLIESPSGLRIVTTSTSNRLERKVAIKSEPSRNITKIGTQEDGAQKSSIVVRQQVSGGPTNVIVKSVTNKPITNVPTSRSVVFNNGQVLGTFFKNVSLVVKRRY